MPQALGLRAHGDAVSIITADRTAKNDTKTVYLAYERILRELKTNQVNTKIVERVDKTIVRPLADIDGAEYDRTRDLIVAFRKALDSTEAEAAARIAAARTAGTQA